MAYTPGSWPNGERVLPTPAQMQNLESGAVSGNALATAGEAGIVKKGVAVVNATDATTAISQLNALLASLRTAGVIS